MGNSNKGSPINGWLIIDKPAGMTSTRIVNTVRNLFSAAKVGHGGTLDPMATGVLPLAFGEATKTLKYIFDAAATAGKKVSVCGELGGDPMATLFLLGLGNLSDLSMDPHSIPRIKKIICQSSLKDAQEFSKKLLGFNSTNEINRFLIKEMEKRYPSDFSQGSNYERESNSF